MPTDRITYQNSGYFTPIINDYLDQKSNLSNLYNHFPTIENFEKQIFEKATELNENGSSKRKILTEVLQHQYAKIVISDLTKNNIQLLKNDNTFTITTGHQLNLFTGPLYFLYKIISTINLTKELKTNYPTYDFVPIYWMATEDHDFDEINYFNFKGKKFRWHKDSAGPVGRLSTKGLNEVFDVFSKELDLGINAENIKKIFEEAYLQHDNLADATRFLANALFGAYGLVILDPDNAELKRQFQPFVEEELLNQSAFKTVSKTIESIKDYTIQVNPRAINLFYIEDNLRERIIFENDKFKINNSKIEFSESEILKELNLHPEKFSPNVIMRPLYEEVILPNLCYIGGGGEIAYWLELKAYFDHSKITFPILLLRNSLLLVTQKQAKKADSLGLSFSDLFLKQTDLINKKTKTLSSFSFDFSQQKKFLAKQFEDLYAITKQTDESFLGAVKAQEAKQKKGLENLERRLLTAEKRKHAEILARVAELQNELFPNKSLQERQTNFSEFYIEKGQDLISNLIATQKPLSNNFSIMVI
jgi:bacillithiol biosynthesis cysteine-adding enzyme BshC